MSESQGRIREQLGRMEASLAAITDLMKERQIETRESFAAVRSEIANIKHQSRSEALVVSLRLENLEKASVIAATNNKRLSEDLAAVRAPVDELITFRRHMSAIGVAMVSIGSVAFVARDALWDAAVFLIKIIAGTGK